MKRNHKVVVWMNAEEKAKVMQRAALLGLDVASFLRLAAIRSKVIIEDI